MLFLPPTILATSVPATSYANSGGVGNRAGIVTASSTFAAGASSPSALVDGSYGNSYWVTGGQTTGVWKFDFGSGAAKYIDEVTWYQDIAANQGTYAFEGSNDDSAWTTLASGLVIGASATSVLTFTPSTTTLWRYFRLRITSGSTLSTSFQREAEFKISA